MATTSLDKTERDGGQEEGEYLDSQHQPRYCRRQDFRQFVPWMFVPLPLPQ